MKAEQPRIGSNRTGIQMAPQDARQMRERQAQAVAPVLRTQPAAMSDMRARYVVEAPPLGSIPPPASLRGVLNTGVALLGGNNQQLLLDKLGERLAFERSAVRIYDALITKVRAVQGVHGSELLPLDMLLRLRDQKAEHFGLLAGAVQRLGGDSTTQTPGADLAGLECAGLLQAVVDPRTDVLQSLHALLIAEMADNSGWELLVAVALVHKREALARELEGAARQAQQHLRQIRSWFERHTLGGPMLPAV